MKLIWLVTSRGNSPTREWFPNLLEHSLTSAQIKLARQNISGNRAGGVRAGPWPADQFIRRDVRFRGPRYD